MTEWTKVITHPLGLAGFALFVVFILLTRRESADQPAWLKGLFAGMALVTWIGGLWLAYEQVKPVSPAPDLQPNKGMVQQKSSPEIDQKTQKASQAAPPKSSVNQRTSGRGSPAVGNTGGDVNITITNP